MAPGSLYQHLTQWAARQPDKPCIIEAETGRALSYIQYLKAVHALRAFLGDEPRCIALALPGGIASAVLWLSALSGGHLLVPLAPNAGDAEKARVTGKYRPDFIFVDRTEDVQGFGRSHARVITRDMFEPLLERGLRGEQPALSPVEGRVCLTTSGSTGEPKGVILTERQIAWTAEQIHLSHQLTPQDRGLTVLPFFHVNAPVVSLCSTLMAGSTVVIAQRFSRRRFWSWIDEYEITWASIVPTILAILLETERPAFLPGALRFVRTASAPLPAADLEAFEARFGIPVIETYGLSEAASQIVANPVPPGRHKPGSAGLPVGIALRICYVRGGNGAQRLRDVAPGEIGEVCVSGPSIIKAYADGASKESFQDGWFHTGDLGYQDEEGYVFLTGRLRDVINRGGENIAPREIEEVLLTHPAVRQAAVVGRPDAIYGEQVVAYIVPQGEWNAQQMAHLLQYAAQKLSPHKVPVDFIAVDALPKNPTGKVARHILRAHEQAEHSVQRPVPVS
jgi:acyl-CoA synthetase (AMP-forming)/AMP-acid ligase II